MREITDQELQEILAKDTEWLESNGKKGKRTSLRGANLKGTILRGANLRGVDLFGADLYGADLFETDLREADLRESNITRQQLTEAFTDSSTKHDLKISTRAQKEIEIKDIEKQLKQKQQTEEELKKQIEELKESSQNAEKLETELKKEAESAKKLKEEFANLQKELENEIIIKQITIHKIKEAAKNLNETVQHNELRIQKYLFFLYLFAALFSLIFIFWYKFGPTNFLTEVKNNTNIYFFLANISPAILLFGLFGAFLTQANKTYRNIREILNEKADAQKLQGALEAKIQLAEQSQLNQVSIEVNEIVSKFIEHHLFNNNNQLKVSDKDFKDDEVNILSKQIEDLKKIIGKMK